MNSAYDVVQTDLQYMISRLREELQVLAGRNVLLVGGAGFLGYYLTQVLMAWNREEGASNPIRLTVFDNFSRGLPTWLHDLAQSHRELVLRRHDITHELPADMGRQDYIIHAASIASPTYYRKHPIETMDANVGGLRRLLDFCVRQADRSAAPVGGFLFFSTSEIYGDPPADQIPTPETYRGNVSCTGPRACYDESKRFGETLCVNFAAQHAVPVTMARPFNNYGPGLKITDRRVLPDFAADVFSGRDIVMLSDGSPTRTFCYIADAVVGYYRLLVRGRAGEAYNIGTECPEISMLDLAGRVAALGREIAGYSGQVVLRRSEDRDYLVDNPNRRCPRIDKARAELGFDPQIDIDEGLRRSMLWYRENRTAEDS